MNRKLKIAFVLMLALASLGAAFAAVVLYRNVETTMRVKMSAALGVFDADRTTPLTTIGLGDFLWRDNFYFPGKARDNMPPQPAPSYWVNNTDQTTLYIQFVSPNMTGVTFAMWIRREDSPTWISLHDGEIYQLPLTSPSLDPGNPLLHAAQWYLQVSLDEPAFGDYTPTLTINACDNPTG